MTLPFENDTGPVIKKLAARSIQTDKRRNLFVIVTIALAAALMAAIFCTGAGSDRKLEADLRGQYQAVVVNCDRDTIEKLKDCPEVERWGLSQNYGSARYGDSVLTVEYADANWMELGKKPSFIGTVPFPVSWTVKMKKKQKETQDILSYHSQAAGCSDKARAKASGGRQPIEECGRTGL